MSLQFSKEDFKVIIKIIQKYKTTGGMIAKREKYGAMKM